jgi:hypothetical protein
MCLKKSLSIVAVAVFCWTLADHLWSVSVLDYPLLPGLLTPRAIANPAKLDDTLSKQKVGFVAEAPINLTLYSILAFAIASLRSKARVHKL